QLFEVLRGVSGIGPKAVLAISSLGTLDQLKNAIEKNDESFFKGIHGVGAKKIQKIILELTGKIKKFAVEKHVDDDAVHGLVALGFSRQRAREALSVVSSDIVDVQERMKQALKILAKK
ncbi:MAG: Holliday junction branch migration protein RuvA, partial [Candidatus Wildermuthbacteria bacterium]|nr:Holliday junction branch migration protein RuvA [Candidatus Wildermuthbacteria bacterium]